MTAQLTCLGGGEAIGNRWTHADELPPPTRLSDGKLASDTTDTSTSSARRTLDTSSDKVEERSDGGHACGRANCTILRRGKLPSPDYRSKCLDDGTGQMHTRWKEQ